MFLPHPRVKVSIVGSLRDREVACSASDRQGPNFESCVWRTVSSQSSHHPQEVLLAQFSLYVDKGGLKPDSFHFYKDMGHHHLQTCICQYAVEYGIVRISLHPCISSLCRPLPDNHQKWIHIYKHFMRPASPNRPRLILHGQTEAVAFSESEQLLLFAFTQGDLTLLCRRNDAKVGHRDNAVSVN